MYHTFSMQPWKTHQFFSLLNSLFRMYLRFGLLFGPKIPPRRLRNASKRPPKATLDVQKSIWKSSYLQRLSQLNFWCFLWLLRVILNEHPTYKKHEKPLVFIVFLTFCNIILSVYSHQNIRSTWHRFHFKNQWISTSRTTQTHLEINNRCDIASKTASKPPRRPQDPVKRLQNASRTPPKRCQAPLRRLQDGPNTASEHLRIEKTPSDASMTLQRRPKKLPTRFQDVPKTPQDVLKTLPRRPKTSPKTSQDASKRLIDTFKRPSCCNKTEHVTLMHTLLHQNSHWSLHQWILFWTHIQERSPPLTMNTSHFALRTSHCTDAWSIKAKQKAFQQQSRRSISLQVWKILACNGAGGRGEALK